jgi:hypothetical protein
MQLCVLADFDALQEYISLFKKQYERKISPKTKVEDPLPDSTG